MEKILYKRSKLGKIQVWKIEIQDNKFRTIEGFIDGAQTPSEWTICLEKNIGRANYKSPEEQSILQAQAKIKKKLESGYTEEVESIDSVEKLSPMLAKEWEGKVSIFNEVLYTQPKLDGIRCSSRRDGLYTRNGKPIVSVPHILQELQDLFTQFDGNFIIDGELYNHELKHNFNEITSIVRTQKPTDEDFEKSKIMEYHIYDIDIKGVTFGERWEMIQTIIGNNSQYIKIVPTYLVQNSEHLDDLYRTFLEDGYEGQMIRLGNSLYENRRTKSLLKRKEMMDAEYEIIDIIEGVGNRSGMMGNIRLATPDSKIFDSGARGNYEYFRELLENKNNYIGKMATIKFQNLTPDGIPRFPVMVAIRDYE
jgi:DNA ligase-1